LFVAAVAGCCLISVVRVFWVFGGALVDGGGGGFLLLSRVFSWMFAFGSMLIRLVPAGWSKSYG